MSRQAYGGMPRKSRKEDKIEGQAMVEAQGAIGRSYICSSDA